MDGSIWRHFDVEPIQDRNDVNIIGFDYGAGNCCACLGQMTMNGFNAKHLEFDPGHNEKILETYFALSGSADVVGQEAMRHLDGKGRNAAAGFKRPLNDLSLEKCGSIPDLTYRQVMQRFFRRALLRVFINNPDQLKEKGRSVIFVGRPAREIWQKHDRDYQKLLSQELEDAVRKLKNYPEHKVDVMIYSEAQAALAYEYSQGNIDPREAVLIIDFGSSTFDAVLVHHREIVTEYSRQLGAGMIDEILTDLLFAQGDLTKLQSVDSRLELRRQVSDSLISASQLPETIVKARKRKEEYYGPEGTDRNKGLLDAQTKEGELEIRVNADCMERVIHRVPVRVQDSYEEGQELKPFQGYRDYSSFYAATDAFIKGVKRACLEKSRMPNRIILTGGASVMPFIRELICHEDNFGPSAVDEKSMNPAFSVGEGLAFMGYVEAVRHETFCRFKTAIGEKVEHFDTAIRSAIVSAYVDISWSSLINDFEVWKVSDKYGNTLTSGIQGAGLPIPVKLVSSNIQEKLNELLQDISEGLQKSFSELFGDNLRTVYGYRVDTKKIEAVIDSQPDLKVASFSRAAMLGFFRGIFTNADTPLTMEERAEIVKRVKERRQQVRDNLQSQFRIKALSALEPMKDILKEGMTEALEGYMSGCTPDCVEISAAEL